MTRHGEFKVPGGKLVVVDLMVVAGRLSRVRVTGDFFLYPDEAMHVLNAALEDMMIDARPDEWAARIRSALPAGTEMLGFGPEDVAEAVRRALA